MTSLKPTGQQQFVKLTKQSVTHAKKLEDHSDSDGDFDIPEEFQGGASAGLGTKVVAKERNRGYERFTQSKLVGKHISNTEIEINAILPVKRVIWRSVRYQSTVRFVYSEEIKSESQIDSVDS